MFGDPGFQVLEKNTAITQGKIEDLQNSERQSPRL
jgi:hypothetical protein